MAGIYIHIPFCKQACSYCNFYFSTNQKYERRLTHAIAQEMKLRKDYLSNLKIESLYFGGGTPSILQNENLEYLFRELEKTFDLSAAKELTLECNPDDIRKEKLNFWKQLGINRLSIGTQSFDDDDLRLMNRAHSSEEARKCIDLAYNNGFDALTIDLIYGIPNSKSLDQNLSIMEELPINHFSAYALTVEPNTLLQKQIVHGEIDACTDEQYLAEFEQIRFFAKANDFEHYELSNFAKKGKRALHNTSYWLGKPYLGLGPSAHSFKNNKRCWNIANNHLYLKKLENKELPLEQEVLSKTDQFNEYIITNIRTSWGVSLSKISDDFGSVYCNHFLHKVEGFLKSKDMLKEGDNYQLSDKGQFLCDYISAELMMDENLS